MTIKIRGLGNLPSFKNRKRIAGKRLITEPSVKRRMNALRDAIVSALHVASATDGGGILMAFVPASLIHSLPHDDCWTVIPELIVTGELVAAGEEGCDITIERIN